METRLGSGFTAAGVVSGIKKRGQKDLGLIYSQVPANVAGMFTKNRVQAAPVRLDKERITSGTCQAVIVNSGNANCCTGEKGMRDARAMAGFAASELGIKENLVLVASTGVIGEPLPIEKIEASVSSLVSALKPEGISDFARAIMTTDTVPKIVTRQGDIEGNPYFVTGVAKGAGMIRPDMATMLCFVCSDVAAGPDLLKDSLYAATRRFFLGLQRRSAAGLMPFLQISRSKLEGWKARILQIMHVQSVQASQPSSLLAFGPMRIPPL